MPRTTSNRITISYPCMGVIIVTISLLMLAVLSLSVYARSFYWTDKAPHTAALGDLTAKNQSSVNSWVYILLFVGIVAIYIPSITLFLYCCIKRDVKEKSALLLTTKATRVANTKQLGTTPIVYDVEIDTDAKLQLNYEELLDGPFSDNILKFLAGIIQEESRLDFFHKLYGDQTLTKGNTVDSLIAKVENEYELAQIPERNFYHLKTWIETTGMKPHLSCIENTLRNMQEEKILTKFRCYLRDISTDCKIKEERNKLFESTNTMGIDNEIVFDGKSDDFKKNKGGEEEEIFYNGKLPGKCVGKKKLNHKTRGSRLKPPVQYSQKGNLDDQAKEAGNNSEESKCLSANKLGQSIPTSERSAKHLFKTDVFQKNKRRKVGIEKLNQTTVAEHSFKQQLMIGENSQESDINSQSSFDNYITSRNTQKSHSEPFMSLTAERNNEHITCRTPLLDNSNGLNKCISFPEYYERDHCANTETKGSQHAIQVEKRIDTSFNRAPDCARRNNRTEVICQHIQPEHPIKPSLKVMRNCQESNVNIENANSILITNRIAHVSSSESYVSVISGGQNEHSIINAYIQHQSSGLNRFYPTTNNGNDDTKRLSKDSQIDIIETTVPSFEHDVSSDSKLGDNGTRETNRDSPLKQPSSSLLKKEKGENYQMSNSYPGNDVVGLNSCQISPDVKTKSFSSVPSRRNEQVNQCKHMETETVDRIDSCKECNVNVKYPQNVDLAEKSTDTSFEYTGRKINSKVIANESQVDFCDDIGTYSFVRDDDEISNSRTKAGKSQKYHRLKRSTDSSSECEREKVFSRRHFQKGQCVSRKFVKGRKHIRSATYPKICEQHFSKGDSAHSSVLYLMKKLMQTGEAMLEKDYIYFMVHTIKQIMECTKECEEKILAMTCKDFENCHEIVSKSGRIIYIIDSDDGFLPPLGVEEWESLKLFKQQRDIVCQKITSENTKFLESVYVFIGFDGKPIRKELQANDTEEPNDVQNISEPSSVGSNEDD